MKARMASLPCKSLIPPLGLLVSLTLANALQAAGDFEAKVFNSSDGALLKYRLHSPSGMDANAKYPVVLFFHGAGERGTDNELQLKNGVRHILAYTRTNNAPAFIIAPHSPGKWVDTPWELDEHTMPSDPTAVMRMAIELIESTLRGPQVDTNRIYVTGLSMGGFGVWDILQRRPDLFAAAIPICGGGDTNQVAQLAHVPIWAFHGDRDSIVKPKRSRDMIAAIEKAGGKPKYTEYKGQNHWVWDMSYTDKAALDWLFAQRKNGGRGCP